MQTYFSQIKNNLCEKTLQSLILFVTGFFMDRSIYFNHATYRFDK